MAEYRRLGYPPLFFSSLHALEVRNAIRQRAFHQRRSIASGERQHVARERDAALARLEHLVSRRALLDVALDMDAAITRAAKLSTVHTERLGARAIDLLHVASAAVLGTKDFYTFDARQKALAVKAGMKVRP